ncbi:MAG TPA: hypothetical protein VGD52_02500 [Pseudoduganella sp.]
MILNFGAARLIEAASTYLHTVGKDFFAHAYGAAAGRAKAAFRER